ncbi:MAG: NTP transferase domain-containing protein [Candidatus Lokiarchaeota archaeon]|nr:NTP transferase domain-containing protein [Candidatus Lokiarchaeota archaeon]
MPTDAIVLAAGEGARFFGTGFEERPLPPGWEYPVPKALFPVSVPGAGAERRPMLEHLVKSLHEGGVETVWIATGHLGEKVDAFVREALGGSNARAIPPHPSIDHRKGPLYTLAGALDYLNENGVLSSQGFDKMVMLSPADLIIDRKAVWYMAGNPARGMMASRSRVHVIVENRPNVAIKGVHTRLDSIFPPRFHQAVDPAMPGWPVVPLVAVHVDVLMGAIDGIARGRTKFAEVLADWLDTNIRDEHEFRFEVNVIQSIFLGDKFYWYDLDTMDAVRAMEGQA